MKKIIIVFGFLLALPSFLNAQCSTRPIINSFAPNTGFIGSTVEIFGANFDANVLSNNQVFFGATEANVISASFGKLTVVVPVGATTAPISVKNQCDLTAYSKVPFNGIFCPTPLTSQTYNNVDFELTGIYGAYNMLSQDVDNDGKPDVIIGGSGGLTIARNNSSVGDMNFTRHNFAFGYNGNVAAADFDGDGLKDIVSTYRIYRNISSGPGNINFQNLAGPSWISSYQIAAGDFNNDGKVDIVGGYGSGVYIAFNTSTGPGNISFSARHYVGNAGGRPTGIQVGDLDGDGKADIVGTVGNRNWAFTIRNTTANASSTASFEAPEYWNTGGTYPYRCQVADFNKDGKLDLTTCNYTNATNTAVFVNQSTPGDIDLDVNFRVNRPAPRANYRIGVGDVDGDGFPDIVTKSLGLNVFSVYPNTTTAGGALTFGNRIDYNSSARAEVSGIVIGDLDGDYVPDIATSGVNSNTIRFHRNTSSQNDVTAPTAVCKNITVALDPTGNVTITPQDVDNGSSDACGIDNLSISQNSFTCADIGPNQVILTVTDNAGNTSTCTATVNVAPAAIIVSGQTTVCAGQTVTMNANTGDTYQWYKDGAAIAGANSQSYVASVSGAYTVAVTNAGGCSGTSDPTNVVVNNNPTVNVSPANSAYLCSGGTTLTASQSAVYQWKKNGVDIPNATLQTYNATTTGTYTVEVIDLFGCSATSSPVQVLPQQGPVASAQNISVDLDPNSGTASITANDVEDGSLGCGLSFSVNPSSFDCSNVGSNNVTLTVTDDQGQSATATATVTVTDNSSYCNAPPVAACNNITVTADAVNGCLGSVTAAAVGAGSSDPDGDALSYSLDNPGPYPVGSHVVQMTVSDGQLTDQCSATIIVVAPALVTSLSSPTTNGYNISCHGGSDGSIDLTVSQGCAPYSYAWSNGATTEDLSGLTAGTYSVTVTDASGTMTSNENITLTEPAPLAATTSSSGYLSGPGVTGNTLYLGYGPQSINLSASTTGGVAPYSYSWNNAGSLSGATTATPVASPQATTTYTVTITDANGCITTGNVTVGVIDARCGKKGKKVALCHNGKTICVSKNAVASHLAHANHKKWTCSLGPCGATAKNEGALMADFDYHLYPNPTQGAFTLQIHSEKATDARFVITDLQGRVIAVKEETTAEGTTEYRFDLSQYAAGVYMLNVITPEQRFTERIMKQ